MYTTVQQGLSTYWKKIVSPPNSVRSFAKIEGLLLFIYKQMCKVKVRQ